MEVPQYSELSNEQRRQIIDVQQAFGGWRSTHGRLGQLGYVYWHRSKGHRYLYEKHGSVRQSHGRDTPENKKRHAEHREQRKALESIAKSLKRRLDDMSPVNRALRLGRLPLIAARILQELERDKLLGTHIIVAGTNALYAYEAATGTIIAGEYVATTDADLLWDTNQSLLLATTGISPEGIMGILRRVDRSFRADFGMNATNRDGYIVDLLCPEFSHIGHHDEKRHGGD